MTGTSFWVSVYDYDTILNMLNALPNAFLFSLDYFWAIYNNCKLKVYWFGESMCEPFIFCLTKQWKISLKLKKFASLILLLLVKHFNFRRFKGHSMLAPFTAGWQTTDLHPLVIEKSEVNFFEKFLFFLITAMGYNKEISVPSVFHFKYLTINCFSIVIFLINGFREAMCMIRMGRNILMHLLVYGPLLWVCIILRSQLFIFLSFLNGIFLLVHVLNPFWKQWLL